MRLPHAFRSLPRPSSALGALASTLCSCSLDYFILRLVTYSSGLKSKKFATGLLRLLSRLLLVQLSRCAGDFSPFRLPFGILKTIQMNGRQFLLRTLARALPSRFRAVSFTLRFLRAIDLGLKPPLSLRLAP